MIYVSLLLYIFIFNIQSQLLYFIPSLSILLIQQDIYLFKKLNQTSIYILTILSYLLTVFIYILCNIHVLKPGLFSNHYYEFFSFFLGNLYIRQIYIYISFIFCIPSYVNLILFINNYISNDNLSILISMFMNIISLFSEFKIIRVCAMIGLLISIYLYVYIRSIMNYGLQYL